MEQTSKAGTIIAKLRKLSHQSKHTNSSTKSLESDLNQLRRDKKQMKKKARYATVWTTFQACRSTFFYFQISELTAINSKLSKKSASQIRQVSTDFCCLQLQKVVESDTATWLNTEQWKGCYHGDGDAAYDGQHHQCASAAGLLQAGVFCCSLSLCLNRVCLHFIAVDNGRPNRRASARCRASSINSFASFTLFSSFCCNPLGGCKDGAIFTFIQVGQTPKRKAEKPKVEVASPQPRSTVPGRYVL